MSARKVAPILSTFIKTIDNTMIRIDHIIFIHKDFAYLKNNMICQINYFLNLNHDFVSRVSTHINKKYVISHYSYTNIVYIQLVIDNDRYILDDCIYLTHGQLRLTFPSELECNEWIQKNLE